MSKVDQLNDSVDHAVPKRDKRINTADLQAIEQMIKQQIHSFVFLCSVLIGNNDSQKKIPKWEATYSVVSHSVYKKVDVMPW